MGPSSGIPNKLSAGSLSLSCEDAVMASQESPSNRASGRAPHRRAFGPRFDRDDALAWLGPPHSRRRPVVERWPCAIDEASRRRRRRRRAASLHPCGARERRTRTRRRARTARDTRATHSLDSGPATSNRRVAPSAIHLDENPAATIVAPEPGRRNRSPLPHCRKLLRTCAFWGGRGWMMRAGRHARRPLSLGSMPILRTW